MDRYADFAELELNEKEGEDYIILFRKTVSRFAVMAPHGGGIEPGTLDIADSIAGSEHTFYAFKGIKKSGNRIMHISSNRYNEPAALKISGDAFIVVSIHGCKKKEETVFIGGRNEGLKKIIMDALNEAEFAAVISEQPGMRGISPENICNRCICGKGVQLEISRGLREKMFNNLNQRSLRKKTMLFYKFVDIIKKSIRCYNQEG
jgi:phage replication-related protein YjqB (UPF0714/DUF867 family)